MSLKPDDYRPLHALLQDAVDPDELAVILDEIAINYARMSLKEAAESAVRVDSPEEVYWLFELRNVFKEVSELSKNL